MIRSLVLGLMLLSLTACGNKLVRDASRGSDLDVLVMGVETMAQSRQPAGDIKRAEDATTTGEVWNLALDLEDANWLHDQDKARIVSFVGRAADRIKLARQPCGFWKGLWDRGDCEVAPLEK